MRSPHRMLRPAALLATSVLLMATSLDAQSKPQTRQGFWISVGLGGGSIGCDDCGDSRESGGTAQIALGGTLNPRLQLGATTNAWSKKVNGVTITQSGLLALAKFYPSVTGGFYLQGGLGVGQLSIGANNLTVSTTGGSALLGLGYDWRVGTNFSITPFLNVVGGSFDSGSSNFNQIGISLTWH